MTPLTQQQSSVLAFLRTYIGVNGYAPSVMEIADHFHWKSGNSAHEQLRALQAKGCITIARGTARGIALVEKKPDVEKMQNALNVIAAWAKSGELPNKIVADLCDEALG